MTNGTYRALSALALGLALAGCGGGGSGGSVGSTPPPPPASYVKIADMTGDRTYQTAGLTYTSDAAGFSNGSGNAFGSGVTISYNAAADAYTVTAPGGSPSQTFGPADFQPQNPATSVRYVKADGTTTETLTLSPSPQLSYALFGSWVQVTGPTATVRLAVGGSPTLAADVPKTGSATFTIPGFGGSANANGAVYSLAGNTTGTFSANFGAGTVATTINLGGTQGGGSPVTNLGSFTGTGTITSGGPGFAGTLTGASANGIFNGAFFGPQAAEMAYSFYLNGANFSAVGQGGGVKQ